MKIARANHLAHGLLLLALFTASASHLTGQPIIQRKNTQVLGATMSYLYTRHHSDTVMVFVHGNPTQAYMWRNIIPYVSNVAACIAPDLIGMGESDKLPASIPDRYSFLCHERYLSEFLDRIVANNKKLILVGHDWGGVLIQAYARKNQARVAGIVIMETFLEAHYTGQVPQPVIDWFSAFRTDSVATQVLEHNFFVERVLISNVKTLSESDKLIYRKPFIEAGEGRLPTLIWPREVPIDGLPKETDRVFKQNLAFMSETTLPKLFVNAEPGALLAPETRRNRIRSWPNVTETRVQGNHYVPEQSPDAVGAAILKWINELRKTH